MIEKAEVYLTINGEVKLEVEQRTPLARVISEPSFYIDDQGKMMPLSAEHSARVVLIRGNVDASHLDALHQLLQHVKTDDFLDLHVTEITVNNDNQFSLYVRAFDFEVVVGTLENLNNKMKNFKAFYQKAKKDKLLQTYKTVNLQFNRQVVCTKL
jgi:cell division protein FtsQ